MSQLALALLLTAATGSFSRIHPELRAFDFNNDGHFDQRELERFFFAYDADIGEQRRAGASVEALSEAARDLAIDALSFPAGCEDGCDSIPLGYVLDFVGERARATVRPAKRRIGWRGLRLERSVTDQSNPRFTTWSQPAVISYRRDTNADNRDAFNLLGGVQLYRHVWVLDTDVQLPRRFLTVGPGVDLVVDGTKEPHESSIEFGVPLLYEWVSAAQSAELFTGHVVTLTPRFGTDRAFNREVYGIDLAWTFSSQRLLGSGYTRRIPRSTSPPRAELTWAPTIQVEFGQVSDAAGNADLEARLGTFYRIAPRIDLILRPYFLHPRANFVLRYFHRLDLRSDQQHPYAEGTVAFDITPTGSVAFTITHSRGRRPPDFNGTNATLVGIGIKLPD